MIFSIVAGVYNTKPEYLTRFINSVNNIDIPEGDELQKLIWDDGSSNLDTLSVLGSLDSSWEVLHHEGHENKGIMYTRKCLADAANGEYTIVIDSDDEIESNVLYSAKRAIKKDNLDLILQPRMHIHEDHTKLNYPNKYTGVFDLLNGVHLYTRSVVTSNIYKTSLLRHLYDILPSLPNLFLYEDVYSMSWWIPHMINNINVGWIPSIYYYYTGIGGMKNILCSRTRNEQLQDTYNHIRDLRGKLLYQNLPSEIKGAWIEQVDARLSWIASSMQGYK